MWGLCCYFVGLTPWRLWYALEYIKRFFLLLAFIYSDFLVFFTLNSFCIAFLQSTVLDTEGDDYSDDKEENLELLTD